MRRDGDGGGRRAAWAADLFRSTSSSAFRLASVRICAQRESITRDTWPAISIIVSPAPLFGQLGDERMPVIVPADGHACRLADVIPAAPADGALRRWPAPCWCSRWNRDAVGHRSGGNFPVFGRAKGATLAEIMKATGWQAHSVLGFISTAGKKHGVKIESTKSEKGDRTYQLAK